MSLYFLVRLLHIGAMSVWMGAGLLAPADVKHALNARPLAIDPLLMRLRRTASIMNASAYLTVASGLALILLIALGPGIVAVRMKIWIGLALTLLAIALGRFLIRPAVMEIAQRRGEDALDEEAAAELARRFAIGVHGESVLRVIILILMVY